MSDSQNFYNIGIAAPNLMVICIDSRKDGKERGRLYSCYSREPEPFDDPYQLLLMMEEVMEKINYPQASVSLRQYGGTPGTDYVRREKPEKVMEQQELLDFRGERATYAVRIQYRQYATWQGELVWMEHNVAKSFNSELEMLKLMDNMRDD